MKTPPQDMLDYAERVLPNAHAPYSNFFVAACVRSEDNQLFAGCNVENAAFPVGACAETGAICALFTAGFKKIIEVLILVNDEKICPPCGGCRQRLLECTPPGTSIHLCTTTGLYEHFTLTELLPMAFGPKNLEVNN